MAWWIGLAVAFGVLLAGSAFGDTVRLKRNAMIEADRPLLLSQVADLSGEYAESLGDLVIVDRGDRLLRAGGSAVLSLNELRSAMQREGAMLGRLQLSGASCALRSASVPASRAEPQEDLLRLSEPQWRSLEDWRQATEQTIEIAIVRRFMQELGVPADRLRLKFQARSETLLNLTTGSRRTVIEPVSVMNSGVVLLRVERFLANGSLEMAETVRVEVRVLRTVLKMREQVSRRQTIPGGVFEACEEWLAPNVDAIDAADAYAMVGRIAQTRLEEGVILMRSQVEEPMAVERNSLVEVIYHGEGFVLRTRARAREAGRRGDLIEVRADDTRQSFLARVDGPGRVVVMQ
ncbi:MAG: flagellar basal body P-ring formation chaperone FlgA [Phycisphaerales bacterium]